MGENKSPTSRRYSKKIVVQMHIYVRDVAEEKLNRLFYQSSCLSYSTAASKLLHMFVFQSNLSWW